MAFLDPGNMIRSFLHPGEPYKNAEQAAQQGYQEAQGYERPYWQQGQDQYGRLNDATGALLDPEALESKWASGYTTSPYAQQLLKQNQASGLDAASAMGLNGSSAALGNIQTGAGNIVQSYRQSYMDDLMKKYMEGIGLGSSIYGTGASAANTMASGAMQHGENMAGLEYGRTAAPGQLYGQLLGMGVDLGTGGAGSGFRSASNLFNRQPNQYNTGSGI